MENFDIFKADNDTFVREINGPNYQKVADAAGLYIAQILRERSFARNIITPRTVSRYDLQVEEKLDQLYFLQEKEVNTGKASNVNFRGAPDHEYVTGNRYRINIQEIATKRFEKTELELLATTQPILKLIEEHSVREMEEVEDTNFLAASDAAAVNAGNAISLNTGGALTKTAIKNLINRIERNRLVCQTILMPKLAFNDFLDMDYTELGSDLLKEVTTNGYEYYKIGGRKIIVSIKNELFTDTDGKLFIYGFAEEKALGSFIQLESMKFAAKREFNKIQMGGWEYLGIGIGNDNACARVKLNTV
jgi:hypothetical protein